MICLGAALDNTFLWALLVATDHRAPKWTPEAGTFGNWLLVGGRPGGSSGPRAGFSRPSNQPCLHDLRAMRCKARQCQRCCLWGASNGQVAVSAFGSGCACPTAVIAICPICQCSAEPQLEVCSAVHPSSLVPRRCLWGGGGGCTLWRCTSALLRLPPETNYH